MQKLFLKTLLFILVVSFINLLVGCKKYALETESLPKTDQSGESASMALAANGITINKSTSYQTIAGFGAAATVIAKDLLVNFNATQQTAILNKFFNTDSNNCGFSIVRLEVNCGTTGYLKSHEPADGVSDSSGDTHQRWFARQAMARGVDQFMSTPWSPPAWMKTNNNVVGGSLAPAYYDKFANYMKTYVDKYRNVHHIPITWISIQNEPDFVTSYESCDYSNAQMDIVAAKVADQVHSLGQGVKVMATESNARSNLRGYFDNLSTATKAKIDIIGVHDYFGSAYIGDYGKPVLCTEVSNMGPDDISINDGVSWAVKVSNNLNQGEVGYLYWWLMNVGTSGEGLINLNNTTKTYTETKRLYTLGQFSRFMRPGDIRIGASSSNATLKVTASKDSDGKAAIVIVNNSTGAITSDVSGLTYSTAKIYRTSATENLAALSDVAVSAGTISYTFPAKSVTTIVESGTLLPPSNSYEAESLATTTSSGVTQADFTDASCSAGAGNKLNSTAINQYVEYTVTLAAAGTYTIKVGFKGNNTRGKFRLYLPQASAYVGSEQDQYSATQTYTEVNLGTYTFSSAGTKQFRFVVTGKNAASTDYTLANDYIIVEP